VPEPPLILVSAWSSAASSVSFPIPPMRLSAPAPPTIWSLPSLPLRKSLPPLPKILVVAGEGLDDVVPRPADDDVVLPGSVDLVAEVAGDEDEPAGVLEPGAEAAAAGEEVDAAPAAQLEHGREGRERHVDVPVRVQGEPVCPRGERVVPRRPDDDDLVGGVAEREGHLDLREVALHRRPGRDGAATHVEDELLDRARRPRDRDRLRFAAVAAPHATGAAPKWISPPTTASVTCAPAAALAFTFFVSEP